MTHRRRLGQAGYYIISILLAVLALIPFLWMISTSLKSRGALMSIPIEWIPAEPTLAVTTFMESWNDYLWPLLMLTDRNKMTLPIALSTLNGQYNTEYNVLMAGSLISMIPIIIIYIAAQKQFKAGLMAGGIKG